MKILFVNPWIYDFAAMNMWSRPLGLMKVMAFLDLFRVEPFFIDCMENGLDGKYGTGKYPRQPVSKPECLRRIPRRFCRYGMQPEKFAQLFRERAPYDAVFVTSVMSYWYPGVHETIEIIKSEAPNVPIVLGGIYATLWHRHACEKSGADFIFKGPAEKGILCAIQTFGFRLKKRPDVHPSRKFLYEPGTFAVLQTSSGCPFSCTYCASGLLSDGFSQRDPQEVVSEIESLLSFGYIDFAFYDDALLLNAEKHIKIILKQIVDKKLKVRFHCPNGLHARFIDDELAGLMVKSGFRTIRLGLETTDSERQTKTGGKVSCDDLIRAVACLRNKGIRETDVGIYLMYGLPGQRLEEVKEGFKFLKELGVRIHLTEFSPIPGTVAWNELVEQGTISDTLDPLLTNNSVFSYLFSGYDQQDIRHLKLEVKAHNHSLQ